MREAINKANLAGGSSTIRFGIPGAGQHIIDLLAPLPAIASRTLLDATTQPGFTTVPLIVLRGIQGTPITGLTANAAYTDIRGFRFTNTTVGVAISAQWVSVRSCFFDLQSPDTKPPGPTLIGISVRESYARIGEISGAYRNVFMGNSVRSLAIDIEGDENNVEGNLIGVATNGTQPLPVENGIRCVGSFDHMRNNVVCAAVNGIEMRGHQHEILSNDLQTDARNLILLQHCRAAVQCVGIDNTYIGKNIVAGGDWGVVVSGDDNVITSNYIGIGPAGKDATLGNKVGLLMIGHHNRAGSYDATERNFISGNEVGIQFWSTGNSQVLRNYIGTDPKGNFEVRNTTAGLELGNSLDTDLINENIISGNTIGVSAPREINLLERDPKTGQITERIGQPDTFRDTIFVGNIIGLNALATAAVPNDTGIEIDVDVAEIPNFKFNIGRTVGDKKNIISGNSQYGITVKRGGEVAILGNYIGTDTNGTKAIGNGIDGILASCTSSLRIGSDFPPGMGNVISGNKKAGINLSGGTVVIVQGNKIGTDASGTKNLGNGSDGVAVTSCPDGSSSAVTIGFSGMGQNSAQANLIAFNGRTGITVTDPQWVTVRARGNLIHANKIDAIDNRLSSNPGVPTENDPSDKLAPVNVPRGMAIETDASTGLTKISGRIDTQAPNTGLIDLYQYGKTKDSEIPIYLGSVAPDPSGHFVFTTSKALAGKQASGAFTSAQGATSEMSPLDLKARLVALEVTQSVQDLKQSVPLILRKKTLVRAYIESKTAATVPVTALLHAYSDGRELSKSPVASVSHTVFPASPAVVARRAEGAATLNFYVQDEWMSEMAKGQLTLWLDSSQIECAEASSVGSPADGCADCGITVTFQEAAVPDIRIIGVRWMDGLGKVIEPPDPLEVMRHIAAIFPISERDIISTLPSVYRELDWREGLVGYKPGVPPRVDDIVYQMQFNPLWSALDRGANPNAFYHCVVSGYPPEDPENPFLFDNSGTSRPAIGLSAAYQVHTSTSPHEIGHLLGRPHSWDGWPRPVPGYPGAVAGPCGESVVVAEVFPYFYGTPTAFPRLGPDGPGPESEMFGLDFAEQSLPMLKIPTTSFELMSYCTPYTRWISDYTYTNSLKAINDRFGKPSQLAARRSTISSSAVPTRLKLIRGNLDFNQHSGSFLPFFDVVAVVAPPLVKPGEYSVVLKAGNGSVQRVVPFEPEVFETEQAVERLGSFALALEWDDSTRSVELVYRGAVLATSAATPTKPTVAFNPLPRDFVADTDQGEVSWTASDSDGGVLTHFIQLSLDGGVKWESLVGDLSLPRFLMNWKHFPATTNALLRVITSDGFHSSSAVSLASFAIAPHAPSVKIASPTAGAGFFGAVSLVCEALVGQVDETIPDARVEWTSSVDGKLGSGRELMLNSRTLTPGIGGTNILTVTVTDSRGQTSSDSVPVVVGRKAKPLLEVSAVNQGLDVLVRVFGDPEDTQRTVQYSADLVNWTTLGEAAVSRELLTEFTDTGMPKTSYRYYRAITR